MVDEKARVKEGEKQLVLPQMVGGMEDVMHLREDAMVANGLEKWGARRESET